MNAYDPALSKSVAPINLDVEQGLLGAVLLNNELYPAIAGFLREDHFSEPVHAAIYAAIGNRVRNGQPASPITLAGDIQATNDPNLSTAHILAHITSSAWTVGDDAIDLARELVRLAVRRELITMSGGISEGASVPGASPKDVLSAAEMELLRLTGELERIEPQSHGDDPDTIIAEAEERMRSGRHWKGATCGLRAIDDKIGGFAPGEFILMAARPSMGKTAVSLSMARRAANLGHGVAFISLEMSAAPVWHRLVSDEMEAAGRKIAYSNIAKGRFGEDELAQIIRAKDRLKTIPLRIVDRGDRLSDLPGHVRNARRWLAKRGKSLDILMIDYLGLLKPGDRYSGNKVNEVGEISSTVKALAKREGIAVIALHQMNRANETTGRGEYRPRLSDLRDSGNLEQDADIVMFVHREAYYIERTGYRTFADEATKANAILEAQNKMEVIVAKQRQGSIGTAHLWCDMATNSVRDEAR